MRILLVSSSVPIPGEAGTPRTCHLVKEVGSRHTVDLLQIEMDAYGRVLDGGHDAVLRECSFATASTIGLDRDATRPELKLLNAALLKPWFATDIKRRGDHRRVVGAIRDRCTEADVVWVDGLSLLQYAEGCGLPIVVDVVDYESRLKLSLARASGSAARRLLGRGQAKLIGRYEAGHLSSAHVVVLNSDLEASLMRTAIGVHPEVVVNGCETSLFQPRQPQHRLDGVPSLVFVGNYTYPPNLDAADYLAHQIAPILAKSLPRALIYLVGPPPAAGFGDLPPNVKAVGYVEDVREYYSAADIFTSPLRLGAGVKNKILEAAAMECPIVATSVSMEGLAFIEGLHYRQAETPSDFVDGIREVLADDGIVRRRLGENARRLVVDRYSWTTAGKQMEKLLERAASANT